MSDDPVWNGNGVSFDDMKEGTWPQTQEIEVDGFITYVPCFKKTIRVRNRTFQSYEEALAYANTRLDALLENIKELETDAIFLLETPIREEVHQVARRWLEIAEGAK